MTPRSVLRERILRTVRESPDPPTHGQRARAATRWLAGGAALVAAELGALVTAHPSYRPVLRPRASAGWSVGLLAVAGMLAALGRGREGPPEWGLWMVSVLAVLLPAWAALSEGRTNLHSAANLTPPLEALSAALALGLPSLLVAILGRRRSDPLHPEAQGAAWGAGVGCAAALCSSLVFGGPDLTAIAVGQIGPALLLLGLGSTLGKRLLALGPRAPPRERVALGGAIGLWLGCVAWVAGGQSRAGWVWPAAVLAVAVAAGLTLGATVGWWEQRRGLAR